MDGSKGVPQMTTGDGASDATSSAERVADELRKAIRHAELLPSEHVRQDYWAKRLGVSRVPVREALKVLVAERLVDHDQHRGYFVSKMLPSDMAQIYRMRILLEPEILRSLEAPDGDTISRLSELVDQATERLGQRRVAEAMELDRQFYFAIYDLSTLRFIVEEAKRLWGMADVYRQMSMIDNLASDPTASRFQRRHRAMVRALNLGNLDELEEVVIGERTELLDRLSERMTLSGPVLRPL